MRSSLIGEPGRPALRLQRRAQAGRVRVFEIGRCFLRGRTTTTPQPMPRSAAIAYGDASAASSGAREAPGRLLRRQGRPRGAVRAAARCSSEPAAHPALHPGRSAPRDGRRRSDVGWIGELHPRWQQKYELPAAPVLFELEHERARSVDAARAFRRFRSSRRCAATSPRCSPKTFRHAAIHAALWAAAPAIVDGHPTVRRIPRHGTAERQKKSCIRVLLQDTRKHSDRRRSRLSSAPELARDASARAIRRDAPLTRGMG